MHGSVNKKLINMLHSRL